VLTAEAVEEISWGEVEEGRRVDGAAGKREEARERERV
jgi:hypothetical protein